MREDSMNYFRKLTFATSLVAVLLLAISAFAQETTAGLQGTVKDPSGAVIPNAQVTVTGTTLIGDKSAKTDSSGYYRFANLPPGTYSLTVKAEGFATTKREGLDLQAGRLPTVDFALQVGKTESVVEVSGEAPLVDVTTNHTQTTVSEDMINNAPHGYSFQSVIQYAPMARNEPLSALYVNGNSVGGTGGDLPGSSGSGAAAGYSIGGAADTETTYLVEGQDTENISAGYSSANVPFDFIQEVQVKTSGVEAEHGGALGGVVNVIMRKGSNAYHGSLFASYESDAMDGSPTQFLRYDPTQAGVGLFDPPAQTYSQKKDHFRTIQPGFTVGGPIKKDRLWFFLGFAPFYSSTGRTVNFGPSICASLGGCPNETLGNQLFNRDFQQYFTTARLDANVLQKVRLFGSWLYQYSRESGVSLPRRDPVDPAIENDTIFTPLSQFAHGLGFSAPNSTYNVGADITLTPKVVSTTRFGYFFQNYHDFGWPVGQAVLNWGSSGLDNTGACAPGVCDNTNTPVPLNLQLPTNNQTAPYNQSYTLFNASKHYQFDQDIAFFKSGWGGTHNFKFGYQFNRLSNVINQNGNAPYIQLFLGDQQSYGPSTTFGNTNCGLIASANPWGTCAGQYGYVVETDFATILEKPAIDKNHALFVQDAWTIGRGLTLNLGLRVEKERLPVPSGLQQAGVVPPRSIDFPWSDKIEPRLGFAWGPASGKMKIFGSYGVINDVMKLLVAQTSWGAQGYDQCAYPLGPDGTSNGFNVSSMNFVFANGRGCPTGGPTAGANFSGGAPSQALVDAASGVSLIENVNYRPWEPIAPGVKPYRQHEYVFGVDYQIAKDWAFEARYDRRRLDHVIEDASLSDPANFEIYTIVNPGEGVNATIPGYANFLGSLGSAYGIAGLAFDPASFFASGTCASCPHNPKAVRDYDGVELRLSKGTSHGWAGMFSYTWSRLWGNYTGLTTTDQTDGGATGRASPDTTRAFDEPFYYFGANGKSNNGPLPTDRPSTLKGNIYYELPWKGGTTTLGLFQTAYQGTPLSTFTDLGLGYTQPLEATYIFGRGQWADVTQDPTTGAVTVGTPHSRRTPWYTQTDLNFSHAVKVNKNNEHQLLEFQATFTNLFNQHAVVGYWQGFDTNNTPYIYGLFPFSIFNGASFYEQVEGGYNVQDAIDTNPFGMIKNSQYGRPNLWQRSRQIRLGVRFTF